KTNSKKTTNVLERIQEAIWEKNYSKCATLIAQARSRYKAIAPWISLTELECLSQLKGKAEDAKRLQAAIQRVEREKDWFLLGPYSDPLKKVLIDAKFIHLKWQSHLVPQEAWRYAENILKYQEWMSADQKADAFKQAGELAFLRQRLSAAKRFV